MYEKYLHQMASPNQIKQTKKTIRNFHLKVTILNEHTIREGLVTIEIKVEGDKVKIKKLVEHFQNTN